MNDLRTAVQQALDQLEDCVDYVIKPDGTSKEIADPQIIRAITALRAALEQPQQEPFDPGNAVARAYLYAGRLEKDIEGLETNANWYELREAFELLAKKAGEVWKAHHEKSAIGFNGLTEAETSASASVIGIVGKTPAQQPTLQDPDIQTITLQAK